MGEASRLDRWYTDTIVCRIVTQPPPPPTSRQLAKGLVSCVVEKKPVEEEEEPIDTTPKEVGVCDGWVGLCVATHTEPTD